jgi:hypothetical protein
MTIRLGFGAGAPTLTLPRKRERELTEFAAHELLLQGTVCWAELPARQGPPPLPLAGEGRGGGVAAGASVESGHSTANAVS